MRRLGVAQGLQEAVHEVTVRGCQQIAVVAQFVQECGVQTVGVGLGFLGTGQRELVVLIGLNGEHATINVHRCAHANQDRGLHGLDMLGIQAEIASLSYQPLTIFLSIAGAVSLLERHGSAVPRLNHAIRTNDRCAAVGSLGAAKAVGVDVRGRFLYPLNRAVTTTVTRLEKLRIVRVYQAVDIVRGDQLASLDHGETRFNLGALGGLDRIDHALRNKHFRLA